MPTNRHIEKLLSQIAQERNCSHFEARRFLKEYVDLQRREKITGGLPAVRDLHTLNPADQGGKARSQKVTVKNAQRTLLITEHDLKPEPKLNLSPGSLLGLQARWEENRAKAVPANRTPFNHQDQDRRCKGCTCPIDELTSGCDTCLARHNERRRNAAKRLQLDRVREEQQSSTVDS